MKKMFLKNGKIPKCSTMRGSLYIATLFVASIAQAQTGSNDASFDVNDYKAAQGANGKVSSLVIQSDDKTVIGGDFTAYNGTAANKIARIKTDGKLDPTFNASSVI